MENWEWCLFYDGCDGMRQLRGPKMAVPMRTIVAPSSIATP